MVVSFKINDIALQATGDDKVLIHSGIFSHLLAIQKIASECTEKEKNVSSLPKTDIQDLDYDNDSNVEDSE